MEDHLSSMTITSIHGVPLKQPIRKTPFGRTFAVTTDGRQWTRHQRDRNKIHGGWVEFDPDAARPISSTFTTTPGMTDDSAGVDHDLGRSVRDGCELCTIKTDYSGRDVDGEVQLHLVIMHQSEGELKHWGLFVGRESGRGEMLQVKGDWLQMQYNPESTTNLFADENYAIAKIYTMALDLTPKQVLLIKESASSVSPPSASSIKDITGNCQTWCCDVLWHLARLGVVDGDKVWQIDAVHRSLLPGESKGTTRVKAMVGGEWTWITRDGEAKAISIIDDQQ